MLEMPLNGTPVTQSKQFEHSFQKKSIDIDKMSHTTLQTRSVRRTPTKTIGKTTSATETQLKTCEDDEESSTSTHIPAFSYSYGSPIVAPDFSQLEDQPRLDPMIECFRSKKEVLECISPGEVSVSVTPKSFLESGGFVQPAALGHFPLPQKGQSLTSFLSSLSDTSQPELDRENAHFNVSEALISAFETMKVKQKAEELQEQRHLERMEALFGETVQSSHPVFNKKKFPLSGTSLRQRQELQMACTETEESE